MSTSLIKNIQIAATNTAGNWPDIVPNIWFCFHEQDWKHPEASSQISILLQNTPQENVPQLRQKSSFNAQTWRENVMKFYIKNIWCCQQYPDLSLRTQLNMFLTPYHKSLVLCPQPAGKRPDILWKMSSFCCQTNAMDEVTIVSPHESGHLRLLLLFFLNRLL